MGIRTDAVGNPAHAKSMAADFLLRFRTMVNGPGQKCLAKARARLSVCTKSSKVSSSAMWEISGLNVGRSLALKMPATAIGIVALAPRP